VENIEKIQSAGQILAYIIRADVLPNRTSFITPPEENQQVGFVVYPKGGKITRHRHHPVKREIIGTSEVLIVRKGRCLVDIYDEYKKLVKTCELRIGDTVLFVAGGHSFNMLEDTIFLEVKQGPYTGVDEKEYF
jgi:quercetin dioxygenase-like cupin family protein